MVPISFILGLSEVFGCYIWAVGTFQEDSLGYFGTITFIWGIFWDYSGLEGLARGFYDYSGGYVSYFGAIRAVWGPT